MFSEKTIAKFWDKVQVGAAGECWPWLGSQWMMFSAPGGQMKVRRFLAELAMGRRLRRDEIVIHEGCDLVKHNPKCLNPAHFLIRHRQRLTAKQIGEIREKERSGERKWARALAREWGVTEALISLIRRGKLHPHPTEFERLPPCAVPKSGITSL
jgi:hypothetical protein